MKKILKITFFVLILMVIWHGVFSILWLNDNGIKEFYSEPKNGLDIVYIGASNAYVHFNPVLAYHKYGFTTGMLSDGNQQPAAFKYLLEEAQKYQKPKVYLIDISYSFTYQRMETAVRKVTDSLKPSLNRYKAINDLLQYTDVPKEEYINYHLSFLTYHNNWKYVNINNFKNQIVFKGHLLSDETIAVKSYADHKWLEDKLPVPPEIDNIFDDLISYIKDKNLNVVFVLAPKIYSNESMGILNSITSKIEDNDLEVWNLKYLDNLNIDYEHDLYNDLHLNVIGATKFTDVFSKFLKEKYNLADHRNDKKYQSWDNEYARYKDFYYKLTKKNYDDLLKELKI